MKSDTTAETTRINVLNNGITYMRFTALLRQPHMRRVIALNLEGKSCDLNNQWTVVLVRWLAACEASTILIHCL